MTDGTKDDKAGGKPPGKPGEEKLDKTRTPGDGTLDGSTPAGLTSEELRERAEADRSTEPGTG